MHLAVNPRDISLDHGDNAAGVQVSPLARPMVVDRAVGLTQWACKADQRLMPQLHRDLGLLHPEVHLAHEPRGFQPEQLLVEFFVLHGTRMTLPLTFFTLPTQDPEAPFY